MNSDHAKLVSKQHNLNKLCDGDRSEFIGKPTWSKPNSSSCLCIYSFLYIIPSPMILNKDYFKLANFEGPLDFLLCLIQKEEIEIQDVPIHEIIQQFIVKLNEAIEQGLEKGAEFIGTAAYLVWLKSKILLPQHEQSSLPEDALEDPQFEIIHHLLDYCRFKQAAKELNILHERSQGFFFRGKTEIPIPKDPKPFPTILRIGSISLDELAALFKELIDKAPTPNPSIQEENWRVCDKIKILRKRIQENSIILFPSLFHSEQTKAEIVVIFLAVLELIKIGEIGVGYKDFPQGLLIYGK